MKGKVFCGILVCLGMAFLAGCASTYTGAGMGDVIINAPVDEVFTYITDVDNMGKCDASLKSITNVQGEGLGMSWDVKTKDISGKDQTLTYIVTEYEPNKKFSAMAFNPEGLLSMKGTMFLTPQGDKTRLTMVVEVSAMAPVSNAKTYSALAQEFREVVENMLDCHKKYIEQ